MSERALPGQDDEIDEEANEAPPSRWTTPPDWPVHLDQEAFDALVADALDVLPREWSPLLDNMAVVVEEEPTEADLRDVPQGDTLFGLYRGAPVTVQFLGGGLAGPAMGAPPEIALFQGPLERASADEADLRQRVEATLVHEIGHHFGYSEDRLREAEGDENWNREEGDGGREED